MGNKASRTRAPVRAATSAVNVAPHVLFNPHLMHVVASFQDGIYPDMATFPALRKLHSLKQLVLHQTSRATRDQFLHDVQVAHNVLTSWYAVEGLDRIEVLCRCLPFMRDVIVVHAVCTANMDVLDHLHAAVGGIRSFRGYLINLAAQENRLDVVAYLHNHGHMGYSIHAVFHACFNANLPMVQFLYVQYPQLEFSVDTTLWALFGGAMPVVRFLVDNHLAAWSPNALDIPAGRGNLALVEYLHVLGVGATTAAINYAASNGHLTMVQWLHVHRTDGATTAAMDMSARHGHLDMVQWLHWHREEGCTTAAMDGAAANGYLDVVQWLHAFRREGCTTMAMNDAAGGGHLEVVQWLHVHRNEGCSGHAATLAAEHGHLHVLVWLHRERRDAGGCDHSALLAAAENNHLHVVHWLVREHRRWRLSVDVLRGPAAEGHLDMVQLLHRYCSRHHAPLDVSWAVQTGQLHVLQWLRPRRKLTCSTFAVETAALDGHLGSVKWWHQHMGHTQTLSDNILRWPAQAGHMDIVKWLLSHRPHEGCPHVAAIAAADNGHDDIADILRAVKRPAACGADCRDCAQSRRRREAAR
ncbi:Aste57867_15214 [Aphanomyces stellatus]|uniref:Aste57867_15214 protein n=1 Tax=Aphanomyces stellatus TaxID=120398 RepID=A0A485L3K6_9STRA|nr:hypothetical protein As57867_015158 [Aphanomyces stellatus]VFT92023.1 Aste57867_15214 [Aphanomyces stellatus]